jgi:hypothetical protein
MPGLTIIPQKPPNTKRHLGARGPQAWSRGMGSQTERNASRDAQEQRAPGKAGCPATTGTALEPKKPRARPRPLPQGEPDPHASPKHRACPHRQRWVALCWGALPAWSSATSPRTSQAPNRRRDGYFGEVVSAQLDLSLQPLQPVLQCSQGIIPTESRWPPLRQRNPAPGPGQGSE